ncbi:MAG: hypothetical protein J2P37_29735, partial [Ktedonobacteraceae bacterium]|nr:hypothetical protein [Ktedonobacteraceae bacterium]
IQLDPSVNCNTLPGAPVGEKMVCQALETYGGYIRDSAGDGVALTMYFEGEDLNDPTRNPPNGSPGNTGRRAGVFGKVGLNEQQELTHIPWNRLRVLKSWNSFTPATANAWPTPSPASLSTLLPTLDPACCDRKRNLNRVA